MEKTEFRNGIRNDMANNQKSSTELENAKKWAAVSGYPLARETLVRINAAYPNSKSYEMPS